MSDYLPPTQTSYPTAPPTPYPNDSYRAPAPRTNALAIASFVAAFIIPLAGLVFGHIALRQIKRSGEKGRGLALAGVILSYCFIALGLLLLAVNPS